MAGGELVDDLQAMERCLELAREALGHDNEPFGSVIVRDGELVAEGENSVNTELDPTAHAETVAIRNACHALGRLDLSGCSLYTSCEPCWICSTAIRQVGISRVVFAASSQVGGYSSAYPILRDATISRFGPPPEITPRLLADRSEAFLVEIGWRSAPRPSE